MEVWLERRTQNSVVLFRFFFISPLFVLLLLQYISYICIFILYIYISFWVFQCSIDSFSAGGTQPSLGGSRCGHLLTQAAAVDPQVSSGRQTRDDGWWPAQWCEHSAGSGGKREVFFFCPGFLWLNGLTDSSFRLLVAPCDFTRADSVAHVESEDVFSQLLKLEPAQLSVQAPL